MTTLKLGRAYLVYFLLLMMPFFSIADVFAHPENLDKFEEDPFANPDLVGIRKCDICPQAPLGEVN